MPKMEGYDCENVTNDPHQNRPTQDTLVLTVLSERLWLKRTQAAPGVEEREEKWKSPKKMLPRDRNMAYPSAFYGSSDWSFGEV